MGCGCQAGTGTWDAYLSCGAVAPQPLAPDSVLQQYAAQAGARSSDFTLCYAVAVLKSRRLIYWKASPGDCGSAGIALSGTTQIEAAVGGSLGSAASVDPEPISKGILAGLSAIFGGFTAAHAQAVATEQSTLCKVTTSYNQIAQQLEQAVKTGALTPDQAATILAQVCAQLDPVLASIYKSCNFSCGFRIALKALQQYNADIVFPALAPTSIAQEILPSAPVVSPGAPGTYQVSPPTPGAPTAPGLYPTPPSYPSAPSSYAGASGAIGIPMNGTNQGIGFTSAPALPFSITPGEIVIIAGIAYIASKPGAVAAA